MYEAAIQQKSTDEITPLFMSSPEDDHEFELIISAEKQDKVQEKTSHHAFFRRPPGGRSILFRRNPHGATHQVSNPEDGLAPRVLSPNSTSSTAETRVSVVPSLEDGSQSVLALNGSTSSTTTTQSQLNIQTNNLAILVEKSTDEKGAPDNSNVETEVPATEEVMLATDESNQNLEEANKKEHISEDQKVDHQNCISESSDHEGSNDDITSILRKMVEEKCFSQNFNHDSARRSEEKEVKYKSEGASIKCYFCFFKVEK